MAEHVEALARARINTLIARARRQMRPSGTEPEPVLPDMGMRTSGGTTGGGAQGKIQCKWVVPHVAVMAQSGRNKSQTGGG